LISEKAYLFGIKNYEELSSLLHSSKKNEDEMLKKLKESEIELELYKEKLEKEKKKYKKLKKINQDMGQSNYQLVERIEQVVVEKKVFKDELENIQSKLEKGIKKDRKIVKSTKENDMNRSTSFYYSTIKVKGRPRSYTDTSKESLGIDLDDIIPTKNKDNRKQKKVSQKLKKETNKKRTSSKIDKKSKKKTSKKFLTITQKRDSSAPPKESRVKKSPPTKIYHHQRSHSDEMDNGKEIIEHRLNDVNFREKVDFWKRVSEAELKLPAATKEKIKKTEKTMKKETKTN